MKVLSTLSTLILFTGLFSCTAEKRNPLEGAWQLVEGKWVTADTTITTPGTPSQKSMKVISQSHFATITQDTTNGTTSFNAGNYTLENDIYTENLTHFNIVEMIGSTAIYKVKFEGDRFIMTLLTFDGDDQEAGSFEEWKRID